MGRFFVVAHYVSSAWSFIYPNYKSQLSNRHNQVLLFIHCVINEKINVQFNF